MTSLITRLGDRLLARFAPAADASAAPISKCVCQCSDACFLCCPVVNPEPGEPTMSCRVANTGECP